MCYQQLKTVPINYYYQEVKYWITSKKLVTFVGFHINNY